MFKPFRELLIFDFLILLNAPAASPTLGHISLLRLFSFLYFENTGQAQTRYSLERNKPYKYDSLA